MRLDNLKGFRPRQSWIVISILLLSLILRWILVFRGGQYYNSDETRYEVSRQAARLLVQGQPGEALQQFTLSPEHLGFKVIGTLPALMEQIMGPSLAMPAGFFSLFSVLNLYLVFLLSRRTSTSSRVPIFALVFAACSLSLLYYSRHLFPYDTAMSFGLLALYAALRPGQIGQTSLACGGLSFLCFITYNGYWPLAAFAMFVNVLANKENIAGVLQKATFMAAGFIAPFALLVLAIRQAGMDLISAYRLFASTITQGYFQEGWSLPFAYFWHTEHMVILILGALSILAVISQFKDSSHSDTRLWTAAILFIYLCLVFPSVFLHYFVVYARLARQLIPFLALLAAQGIFQVENRTVSGYKITRLALAVLFLQAAWNFSYFYGLRYPREFAAEAQTRFPEFEFSLKRLAFGAPVICQHNGYIAKNVKFYATPPEEVPQVQGQLLLSASHPANSLPYQYEGDPPEVRKIYSKLKLRMEFYKVDEKFMSEANPDWLAIKNCVVREDEE